MLTRLVVDALPVSCYNTSMERYGEYRETSPHETLELIRQHPESRESIIEGLDFEELDKLVEFVAALIIEADPELKAWYQQLLKYLCTALANRSTKISLPLPVIDNEYSINGHVARTMIGGPSKQFYHLLDVTGIYPMELDRERSQAYLCCITSEEQSFWVNMQFFRIVLRDGREGNFLYIGDRYVAPDLRGNGIGDQLLQIADSVGVANGCNVICAKLIPEDPGDMELLKRGHEKAGYEVSTRPDGLVTAIKDLRSTEDKRQ